MLKFMILTLDSLSGLIARYSAEVNPDSPVVNNKTLGWLNSDIDDLIQGGFEQQTDVVHATLTSIIDGISHYLNKYNIEVTDFRTIEIVSCDGTILVYFGEFNYGDIPKSQCKHT